MEAKTGVAVFGVGRAGQYHLPNLAARGDVRVRWVVDVEAARERARDLCERHGVEEGVQFLPADRCEAVFEDPETVAVIVTTPTRFHEDITKRALRAGKHVFCEKPISFTADVVRSCYQEAEQQGKVLFCGFNKRFDDNHVQLKREVQSGSVGAARAFYCLWRDPASSASFLNSYITPSGGILCDSAIHQLDYVPWLLGEKPCSLVASGGRTSNFADIFAKSEDVDSAVITLRFPSGAQAVIEVTRESPLDFFYFRMEVLGTKATSVLQTLDKSTVCSVRMGEGEKEGRIPLSLSSSYKNEMDSFVRVIQGKEECPVPAQEVIQAHTLADLCLVSLREGRVVDCSHL
ncbi:myo-inositol 2-dehydrogenase-like [Babylonia areolata]|uniref:myo-inositol 2-dehydrogenase-like n=1 Tax=Babylonia areolata TaxID=304850 RepID=UPI003FD1412E